MPDAPNRLFIVKRLLIVATALAAFTMATIIGSRLAVESLFKGIASSRSSALSAISWDVGSQIGGGYRGVRPELDATVYDSTRPFSSISSSLSHRSGMLAEPSRRISCSAPRTSLK
jgi:hypothetical protein